jgi:hypothetical protein
VIDYLLTRLGAVATQLPALSREKRKLHDNALRAISHALNETYLYYRDLGNGHARDEEIEAQLSRYWAAAAIPLRHLDQELAAACEHKSEYWLRPQDWTEAKVKQVGIGLDNMRHRYRRLLTPNRLSRPFRKGP